ncbi:MAG: ABC transporter permease subunit [Chthoniobacterales bacterium]|nr:ABC transporter permease subunit [Chthoniobacterales bacterium]MCX7713077.1 ABC transporter permease subunit [Chthoniobacterales bacterium]
MKPLLSLYKRELISYFTSPIAYIFLIIFLTLAGFFPLLVSGYLQRGEADLLPFFSWMPWLFLILAPAIGMRLWSEERRQGTIELLLTLPILPWHAILAKFLAACSIAAIALLLTFPMPLTANYLGNPDNGAILTGYLGSFLLAASNLSIASFTSILTRNQVISFILSLTIGLFLVLAGWPPITDLLVNWASQQLVDLIASFSIMYHFDSLQRGILDLRDIAYFLSLIAFGLISTSVLLNSYRSNP